MGRQIWRDRVVILKATSALNGVERITLQLCNSGNVLERRRLGRTRRWSLLEGTPA